MSKRIQEGKQLLEKGLFEKAIDTLTIQITSTPRDVQALYLRAIASRKLNKLYDSLKDFNKAIELNPLQAEFFSDRGILFYMMQEETASLQDMDKSVALEPENPCRYSSRAFMKDFFKDSRGAIMDYEKAIELDPEDEISRNNLALIQERIGRMKEAKRNFMISDKLLKKKGEYIDNEEFKDVVKEELEINKSADGKVSFKSKAKKKVIESKLEQERKEERITILSYLKTLFVVFTSGNEFKQFIQFARSFFIKSK